VKTLALSSHLLVLVVTIQHIVTVDPTDGRITAKYPTPLVSCVSWDKNTDQLFRIVFQNGFQVFPWEKDGARIKLLLHNCRQMITFISFNRLLFSYTYSHSHVIFFPQLIMLSDDRFQIIKSLVGFSKVRNPGQMDDDAAAFIPTELDCECDFLVHFIDFSQKGARVSEGSVDFSSLIFIFYFYFIFCIFICLFFTFSYLIGCTHNTTHGWG
jgi:hypothetical protein